MEKNVIVSEKKRFKMLIETSCEYLYEHGNVEIQGNYIAYGKVYKVNDFIDYCTSMYSHLKELENTNNYIIIKKIELVINNKYRLLSGAYSKFIFELNEFLTTKDNKLDNNEKTYIQL